MATTNQDVNQSSPVEGKALAENLTTQLRGAHTTFSLLLDEIKTNNKISNGLTIGQLKYEREIAVTDGDKREDQLDDVIKSLQEVRSAVTGFNLSIDIEALVNVGNNQTKLLEELIKETSLSRKLSEGSVEYDKAAAQYRNTSGRDIESKVSGKTSKDNGFIDFETARDTLSGQGKRVRDENAFSLKPINYSPGKAVAAAVGAKNKNEDKEDVDNFDPSLLGRLKSFMTDGESDRPGYGLFQKPPIEVEKKEREAKVSSPRQENPEADNINTTGEIEADAAKSDLELSKQMLDTTREQLTVLKEIKDALAPKTPTELTSQKSTPYSSNEGALSSIDSPGIPDFNFPRRTPTGPNTPSGKSPKGKVPTTKPGGKIPTGAGKLGLGLKLGGGLLAGAGLALGAYEASEFLDETGYGDKMKAGAGQSAEKAFRENVAPTIDPSKAGVIKEQAIAALENGSPRDITKLGGKDALMKIAGLLPVEGVSTEQAAAARSNYAAVDPRRVDTAGREVSQASTENKDMERDASGKGGANNTVVSNNVSSINTTKFVPMKLSPRAENTGSALDRYTSRITTY
jgi:hypothetical protein